MKQILLSALLSLTLAFPVPGALNFNATTAEVDFGSAASLDDLGPSTWMFIYRPSTLDATFRYLWRKSATGATNIEHHDSDIGLSRAYSGTNLSVFSTGDVISAGNWYVSFFIDAGVSVNPRIYHALLGTALAEVSYGSQTAPMGTVTGDAAASVLVGFRDATRRFIGDIAVVAIWEEVLSLDQCKQQYWRAFPTANSRMLTHLGFNGTGTQADWSGNLNTGAVTAATVTDHAPLPQPF